MANAVHAVEAVLKRKPQGEFTFERLLDLAGEVDERDLASALALLVNSGRLKQIVRIESPYVKGGGIGDFDSIVDVPERIRDERSDTELTVTPSNLRVLYRVPTP
jgi:hypothetical protein